MRITKKIRISIFLLLLSGFWTAGWCSKIVRPWRATTAIVKAGETFEVWFDADTGQTINSVELVGPYNTVFASGSVAIGSWVYDKISGNTYDMKITVTVPSDAPADRYELVLKTSTGNKTSPGAVKVIKEYKNNYYILHMSDAHRAQSDPDYIEIHTLRKVSEILKIANIIDPEMIFETGDNQYNIRNHPEREESYYNGIPSEGIIGVHDAFAATFMAAGNHDSPDNDIAGDSIVEAADFFNTYYGLHIYNFTYGNGRFTVHNNAWGGGVGDMDRTGQGNDAVAWLNSVGRGNFVLGAAHCMEATFEPFHNVVDVDLAIVGHNHFVANENPHLISGDAINYVADSVRDLGNFEFNLFQVNNNTGAWIPVSGSDARCQVIQGDSQTLIADPDQWIPNLEISYSSANNGSASANTATIVNRYDFDINSARVRFVMPLGSSYEISQGVIQQAFDGDSYCIVDVSVDLGANSTTVVDIGQGVAPPNNSQFISQSVLDVMDPGQTYPVSVAMKNIGTDTWTADGGHKLGSQPGGDTTWGVVRVDLEGEDSIAPDQTKTFTFNVTAPSVRGTYNFQWRMVDDVDPNQDWFGASTPVVQVQVGAEDIHIEAEDFTATGGDDGVGFQTQATSDVGGGENIGFTAVNDWATYNVEVTHAGIYKAYFRYASATAGAKLDLKNGSTILCSVNEAATGDFQTWQTSPAYLVTLPEGSLTLTIFATGPSWNMNWFELIPLDDPPGNVPPVIQSSPDTSAVVNEAYSYNIYATDADPDTLTYAAPVKPGWLAFNAGTRVLSGTPLVGDIGTDAVSLTVYDGTVTVTQSFNIVVSAEPVIPGGEVILAVDLHQNLTDPLPVTPDYFAGWFVGNVSAGVAAPSTTINGYAITIGSGTSIDCLVTPASQTGMNARNRTTGHILNDGDFTQADMMRERVASLVSPTDPAVGNGTGNGLYLKVSGLSANTLYAIQAWGVDSTGAFTNSNVALKNGYNYGYDATAETGGYASLPQLGTYTVVGSPTTIADNDQYSISGTITTDSSGTLIYKQISNIDKSVMNGFVLSTVDAAPLEGYDAWADSYSIGAATADDDADGRDNLLEYAIGGNPTNAVDVDVDPVLTKTGDELRYSFQQRNDDTSLIYKVQRCDDLLVGGWSDLVTAFEITDTNGVYESVSHTIPTDETLSYIRLKVESP